MKQSSFRILLSLVFAILSAAGMGGCDRESATPVAATAAPLSPLDAMINDYEKTSKEYDRVASKIKSGDVSLTVRYIDSGKRVRELTAKLNQEAGQMSPAQKQRIAAISAANAPYLQQ
ncbi:hypothetical protein BH20VER3_BH20VER3_09460 [soil metagenome]